MSNNNKECPSLEIAVEADKRSELAMQKIEAHEKHCSERYSAILNTQGAIGTSLESIEKKMWKASTYIIGLLFSVTISLLYMILKSGGVS